MRGRTALLIFALALALLFAACAAPQSQSSAVGDARESALPVSGTPAGGTDAGAASAGPDASERGGADVSLRPAPQHTGVNLDGTLSRGALLLGDSLTAGLAVSMLSHGTLGEARYLGIPSFSLQDFRSAPYFIDEDTETAAAMSVVCSPEFSGLSFAEAAQQAGASVEAIYFMLGTNLSGAVTEEAYAAALRYLCDCCPNATVYAETIPYSRSGLSDYARVNAIIWQTVTALRCAGNERVFVLDTFHAIGSEHNIPDGLHLDDAGLVAWRDAIVDNALNMY